MATAKFTQNPIKGKITTRQAVMAFGILFITFGVFGWQLKAFNQRENVNAGSDVSESPPDGIHWDEAPKEVRMAVAASIRGQLEAFQRGDYGESLQFHSKAVRQEIPTAEEFKQVINARYPFLAYHRRATFWFVNTDRKHRYANAGLTIVGKDGNPQETVYRLVFQDGSWLISGIATRPPNSHPKSS
jgi:hypothetical protein